MPSKFHQSATNMHLIRTHYRRLPPPNRNSAAIYRSLLTHLVCVGHPCASYALSTNEPRRSFHRRRGASTDRGKDEDLRAVVQALTIVWHPDVRRVGEMAPLGRQKVVEISGKTLPFDTGTDVALSRATFLEIRARPKGVELRSPPSSTTVEVAGRPRRWVQRICKAAGVPKSPPMPCGASTVRSPVDSGITSHGGGCARSRVVQDDGREFCSA
jgi:hypothetical protein